MSPAHRKVTLGVILGKKKESLFYLKIALTRVRSINSPCGAKVSSELRRENANYSPTRRNQTFTQKSMQVERNLETWSALKKKFLIESYLGFTNSSKFSSIQEPGNNLNLKNQRSLSRNLRNKPNLLNSSPESKKNKNFEESPKKSNLFYEKSKLFTESVPNEYTEK